MCEDLTILKNYLAFTYDDLTFIAIISGFAHKFKNCTLNALSYQCVDIFVCPKYITLNRLNVVLGPWHN